MTGSRDGTLMKRGRDNGQFLSRRFVLSEREGTLKYYTKFDVSVTVTDPTQGCIYSSIPY